jgi:hypothetical protein
MRKFINRKTRNMERAHLLVIILGMWFVVGAIASAYSTSRDAVQTALCARQPIGHPCKAGIQ